MKLILGFLAGVLFSCGLVLSGMTQPHIVIGFLDFWGAWDPRLAFVMIGAIGVYVLAVRILPSKTPPLFSSSYSLPAIGKLDRRLFIGSALFGIGWGIGGICPGPAIVSLGTLNPEPYIFTTAMIAGMLFYRKALDRLKN